MPRSFVAHVFLFLSLVAMVALPQHLCPLANVMAQSTGSGAYRYDNPPGATANAQTPAGLALMAPASNTATCACVGCASNQVSYQNIWYWSTGLCTNNPFIQSVAFQATDAATKFRVFTTRTNSVAAGTFYYGAGSSMKLTMDSVTCFNAAFQPGYTNALIASQSATGQLYVVLYCDTPAGCNFNWKIDGGCTAATVTPTVSGTAMDSCMASCNPNGGTCSSGVCTCLAGFSGDRCQTSTNTDPCTSVNCGAHGTCSSGTCACRDGYTGSDCSTAPPASSSCASDQTCTQGQCWTNGGLVTTFSCSCICGNGSMQPLAGATSCSDCTSRCSTTSCTSGTSCSSSSSSSSPKNTGVACGSSSGTNAASSSTGAASTSNAYDPTAWLGMYSSSGCSSASCCCAGAVTIAAANDGTSDYLITGSDLTGSCGGAGSITASASPPTSATYTYLLAGQSHTATLSGSTISDYNTPSPSCSATLTRSTVNNGASGPANAAGPFQLLALSVSAAVAILAAFA